MAWCGRWVSEGKVISIAPVLLHPLKSQNQALYLLAKDATVLGDNCAHITPKLYIYISLKKDQELSRKRSRTFGANFLIFFQRDVRRFFGGSKAPCSS